MTTDLRLIVFDCDGTLVDSQHSIIACMRAAFAAESLPSPTDEEVRRVVGLPLLVAMEVLAPHVSAAVHEKLRIGYSDAWQELRRTTGLEEPLYPGVHETLDALEAEGWLMGVATGKSYRGLQGTLERHGILPRFITLQTADRAPGKPNPDMLYLAMEEAGTVKSSTVMVGDTTYDMEMSVNAGVPAIGVAWGYHGVGELKDTGARVVISEYAELLGALNQVIEDRS